MGLRGIGAKPVKKTPEEPQFKIEIRGRTRADRVISFIESLPVTSGMLAGRRFRLSPEQKKIIREIYRTRKNGRRIVREALLSFPRKNGKTTLTAALALCHLCGPEAEEYGEVYSAAMDRPQAAIIFRAMKAMVLATDLQDRIIIRDFAKSLEDSVTHSIYQALSSDVPSKHGYSASFWAYDELAQAGPDRRLYDVLRTSVSARREPLGIVLSTMSPDPKSVMQELVNYAQNPHRTPSFYGAIYSAPMDSDPWSEATWRACNPGIGGGFRDLEELKIAAEQAQHIPARESSFRLLYLNQPVEVDDRFISRQDWQACGGEIDVESLRGRPCFGGLDLSSTQDLTSLVLYFPEDSGAVLSWFWVPKDRLQERADHDHVPYPEWHAAGLLEAPAGRAIDRMAIIYKLAELAATYDIQGLAYDRWRIEDLQKLLSDESIDITIKPFGQGYQSMGPAVDALETSILNRTIKHGNHPILNWCMANVVVEMDPSGARKLSKRKSRERIDGAVSLVMALGLHAKEPTIKELDLTGPFVISV